MRPYINITVNDPGKCCIIFTDDISLIREWKQPGQPHIQTLIAIQGMHLEDESVIYTTDSLTEILAKIQIATNPPEKSHV